MFIFLLLFLICFFALATISVRNPVHSVLGLVSVFLVSAALLFCLEVEFLAFSFIIVYVGAIAILFLFVVMMLDIKIGDTDLNILKYGPLGYFITFIFALEITRPLVQNFESIPFNFLSSNYSYINWFDSLDFITNIEAIGQLLYTYYFVYFLKPSSANSTLIANLSLRYKIILFNLCPNVISIASDALVAISSSSIKKLLLILAVL